ncbi:MAG: hypothetical protein WDZ32_00730 [Candidatus Saccharimonadales bacterium]
MKNIRSVAIDVDDVLMPHMEAMLTYYYKAHNIEVSREDLEQIGLLDNALSRSSINREDFIADIEGYLLSSDFNDIPPFNEAIEAINKLKESYSLNIVTARPKILHKQTKSWLQGHFPGVFADVRFTNYGSWGYPHKTESKANVCQVLGADLLIDDSPSHIIEAIDCGMIGLLFGDYPWNRSISSDLDIERVPNWEEVVSRLM